ncbi:hypothetical protein TCON_1532 [Astathelohania contejeani]|uniref:Uncharacterized protein n=1 Tax=Astathelohania contejeani TaxID=164912 RepID=A0ABQ7HYH4_9MICR|nr:hypothetical protein TCON_1532 [Thelohania contejeani]
MKSKFFEAPIITNNKEEIAALKALNNPSDQELPDDMLKNMGEPIASCNKFKDELFDSFRDVSIKDEINVSDLIKRIKSSSKGEELIVNLTHGHIFNGLTEKGKDISQKPKRHTRNKNILDMKFDTGNYKSIMSDSTEDEDIEHHRPKTKLEKCGDWDGYETDDVKNLPQKIIYRRRKQ